jgi:maltodextrin utilization protein YvdJ
MLQYHPFPPKAPPLRYIPSTWNPYSLIFITQNLSWLQILQLFHFHNKFLSYGKFSSPLHIGSYAK